MIESKVIADSVSEAGRRITTLELTYPRFIHSEFMTHRVFSRNAASSRAIPFERVCEQVENNPVMPEEWGLNRPGMQASENAEGVAKEAGIWAWKQAAKSAVVEAKRLNDMGFHKQIVNRVLEPFVHMKTVVTSTDWENFFWLRLHKDAQPEIRLLAESMKREMDASRPSVLKAGQWHLPYFEISEEVVSELVQELVTRLRSGKEDPIDPAEFGLDKVGGIDNAIRISASCCAQVSYRTNDDSLEKAKKVSTKLMGDGTGPVHASPFEHQAQALQDPDKRSGNFRGWLQMRQTIPGNVKKED